MIKHSYIEGADGVRLHAAQAGERGSLLLFLHGFPECWQAWHRQLSDFARDHRAVALDLRGYNLSDKPADTASYALPRIVDDLRHVIRALSPDRPAQVVGHDWGGIAAWLLARESPELFDRMVILNAPHPAVFYRELKHNPLQCAASSYAAFFQWRGVAEAALRAFDFAALRGMVFGTSAKPHMFPPELRATYREAWSRPHALTAGLNYYRNLRALQRVVKSSDSWKIDVPTLVLWGERDTALLKTNLIGLDQFVSQLQIQRHPGATHWIVHEEPDWVNAAIRAFIASDGRSAENVPA
jgi:epoxide hydrolase 4